jgi:Tfp pilus assembly protein PilN
VRPVNLIPPEDRAGASAPLRAGGLAYVLVAALALALGAVTITVLTSNKVEERKAEKSELEAELQQAQARAEQLKSYTQFASLSQARRETVVSLAKSRFDWERVLRELAIVIPDDVWLVHVTGTVSPDVAIESAADVPSRAEVPGPALAFVGCGTSQNAVARFAADLRDIDGVTRVGVSESKLPSDDASSTSTSSSDSGTDETNCQTRDFIAQFKIVAAFDAVPTEVASSATPTDPAAATTATATPTTSTETVSEGGP